MARNFFGGTIADFVVSQGAGGLLQLSSATLTFWESKVGGDQYTDLILGNEPVTTIPVASDGQIPRFQGPDGVAEMWLSAGGTRVLIAAPFVATAGPTAEVDPTDPEVLIVGGQGTSVDPSDPSVLIFA